MFSESFGKTMELFLCSNSVLFLLFQKISHLNRNKKELELQKCLLIISKINIRSTVETTSMVN